MWCIDLNPPKCIISRDVIFNENELIVKRQPIEETNFDTKTFEIVEFVVEASGHKSIKGVAYSKDANIDPNNTMGTQPIQTDSCPQEQSYQLTKDRMRRTMKPPKRFVYVDMIAFALTATQEINVEEPKTFK